MPLAEFTACSGRSKTALARRPREAVLVNWLQSTDRRRYRYVDTATSSPQLMHQLVVFPVT